MRGGGGVRGGGAGGGAEARWGGGAVGGVDGVVEQVERGTRVQKGWGGGSGEEEV